MASTNLGLDEFIAWYTTEQHPAGFTKATVVALRVALEARGLGPISSAIPGALTAIFSMPLHAQVAELPDPGTTAQR
jgi:hypothetical protein